MNEWPSTLESSSLSAEANHPLNMELFSQHKIQNNLQKMMGKSGGGGIITMTMTMTITITTTVILNTIQWWPRTATAPMAHSGPGTVGSVLHT